MREILRDFTTIGQTLLLSIPKHKIRVESVLRNAALVATFFASIHFGLSVSAPRAYNLSADFGGFLLLQCCDTSNCRLWRHLPCLGYGQDPVHRGDRKRNRGARTFIGHFDFPMDAEGHGATGIDYPEK